MQRAFASLWVVMATLLVPMVAQDRQAASERGYLLIDAAQARSRILRTTNFSKIRDRLAEAGNHGYGLVSLAGSSSSANLLMKRDGGGPRTYRLIFDGREGGFLNNLNKAASEGLRVIPGTIKAFEDAGGTMWMTVVAPAPDATRVSLASSGIPSVSSMRVKRYRARLIVRLKSGQVVELAVTDN